MGGERTNELKKGFLSFWHLTFIKQRISPMHESEVLGGNRVRNNQVPSPYAIFQLVFLPMFARLA